MMSVECGAWSHDVNKGEQCQYTVNKCSVWHAFEVVPIVIDAALQSVPPTMFDSVCELMGRDLTQKPVGLKFKSVPSQGI